MKELKTIEEAEHIVHKMYFAHCNKWKESGRFPGKIYWTHGKNEDDVEFPVIYSTFDVIDATNKKLFNQGLTKVTPKQ